MRHEQADDGHPLWMAVLVFGRDAVTAAEVPADDLHRVLRRGELDAIARRSRASFWADERTLFGREPPAEKDARILSAADALQAYGLDLLYEARERGGALVS